MPMPGREAAAARAGREVATRNAGGEVAHGGGKDTVHGLIQRMQPEFARALPKHMDPDRLARIALTVLNQSDQLKRADPMSFLGALMTCAQVGLEPGPQGHAYLVPYGRKVTFIMGYQGMIELARRSGQLKSIAAHTIYQAEVDQDRFAVGYGTSPYLKHEPIVFGDRGPAVGFYAAAKLKSGEDVFVVLTRDEVDAFRRRSATQKKDPSGPWETDYEAMAWKTCVRRLARWLPQSPELAAALAHDDTERTAPLSVDVTTGQQPKPAEPFTSADAILPGGLAIDPAPVSDPSEVPFQPEDESAGRDHPDGDGPEPGGDDDPWANT